MKKNFFTTTLAVLMIIALMSTTVFAADFVKSPSVSGGPSLEGATSSNPDWNGEIILTPYEDRDTLPEERREMLEDAYDSIKDAENLTDLNEGLKDAASKAGVDAGSLAVDSLFDLRSTEENHGEVTITLTDEELENFVALMRYNGSEWELVDATLDGNKLTFTTSVLSAFAIVVSTSTNVPDSPQTGDSFPWVMLVGAVVTGTIGAAALYLGSKKEFGI